MSQIFTIRNLNVYYDEFQALKDISMTIQEKSVTALIGPSGCGKSTFIRCLNRMNDLIDNSRVQGTIELKEFGDIQSKNPIALRKKVGMVFQEPNPFPMNIFENVAYGPKRQGVKDKQKLEDIVTKSLKQAALYDEVKENLKKSAMQLSGGQQQRLCIARALAMSPDILLMDEPTSALDPIATKKIENLIFELKKHFTIIIVTHSMQQASRIADYTAFFYMGSLKEYDKTNIIFTKPSLKQTEDYVTGKFG